MSYQKSFTQRFAFRTKRLKKGLFFELTEELFFQNNLSFQVSQGLTELRLITKVILIQGRIGLFQKEIRYPPVEDITGKFREVELKSLGFPGGRPKSEGKTWGYGKIKRKSRGSTIKKNNILNKGVYFFCLKKAHLTRQWPKHIFLD